MTDPDLLNADSAEPGPQIAVLMYPGVSELELGLMLGALLLAGGEGSGLTVARSRGSVVCAGGLVSTPQVMFAALPEPAGVLVPGGTAAQAQKAARDPLLRGFLERHGPEQRGPEAPGRRGVPLGASGRGLLLVGEAGLLRGRRVGCAADLMDTVWNFSPDEVRPQPVTDGALHTAPGGLGALYAALGVIGAVWGDEVARRVEENLGGGEWGVGSGPG